MFYQNQFNNTYYYVNGLEGARQYQMLPNQSVLLMDAQQPMFYLKTSNQLGQANIRCFEFKEITTNEDKKYATIESVNAINDKLDKLLNEMKGSDTNNG